MIDTHPSRNFIPRQNNVLFQYPRVIRSYGIDPVNLMSKLSEAYPHKLIFQFKCVCVCVCVCRTMPTDMCTIVLLIHDNCMTVVRSIIIRI